MTAKKLLIPFILASIAGHALVIALTIRINPGAGPQTGKVFTVQLKSAEAVTPQREPLRPPARNKQTEPVTRKADAPSGYREETVALQNPGGPYEPYLIQLRRKIERLWSYPAQAVARKEQGEAVILFTIDAGGVLNDYYVTSSSGSPLLDEGALAVVRAASPFEPLPAAFNLSRLHVTASFRYRIGE
ncbi:MAG: energy transducer TonB [Deltaproteobacteria bacterium]|nr:energy transducer TonB [Deltaproteobacteria bacterium]